MVINSENMFIISLIQFNSTKAFVEGYVLNPSYLTVEQQTLSKNVDRSLLLFFLLRGPTQKDKQLCQIL